MRKKVVRAVKNVWQQVQRKERLVAPAALIIGFVLDTITLNRIDQVFDQLILLVHLLIVSTTIVLLYRWYQLGDTSGVSDKWASRLYTLMAFSVGGIYSGLVIFYGRSGALLNSWPLLVILVVFLFGSEFAKKYFKVLSIQLIAFAAALYLYLIILLPLLFNDMGTNLFILSSFVWLTVSLGYVFLLARRGSHSFRGLLKKKGWLFIMILLLVQVSYFSKVLPPVPLSLKFDAVYHRVVREGNIYRAEYEPNPWWQFWDKRNNTLTHRSGQPAYVFTSVFAPNKFRTNIFHEWQYKKDGKWITTDRIRMTIVGGSDGGYRGYSFKTNFVDNVYRVRTITEDERVIGVTFVRLKETGELPETEFEEL